MALSTLTRVFGKRFSGNSIATLYRKTFKHTYTCFWHVRKISGDNINKMAAKLRLVQLQANNEGEQKIGVELEDGGNVVDIAAIYANIPKDMKSFLENWEENISVTVR